MKAPSTIVSQRLILRGRAHTNGDATVTVLAENYLDDALIATCTTVPSATAGYAIGCQLIHTTTGQIYVNVGSATSCSFAQSEGGTSASPAAAGNSLATATDLTADVNYVTGADGTKGVSLPTEAANNVITVINGDTTNNLLVYPSIAGSQINALGAGNAYTVTPGQAVTFVGRSASLYNAPTATDTITGLTASAAELNFNDTAQVGVAVPSKTLVLGADKNVDVIAIADLKIGAGAGTSVTSTAAELNLVDGSVITNDIASKAAMTDASKRLRTAANVGAAGVGCTAVELGDGMNHTTIITVNQADALTVADDAALADGYLIYTLPAGAVIVNSAYMSMAVTAAEDTTATADVGLGTTIGSGANATLNLVAAGAAENILTGQTAADCNGTATVKTAIPTAAVPLVIEAAGDHTVYFNVADTWANTAGADLTADIAGTVVLNWQFMA